MNARGRSLLVALVLGAAACNSSDNLTVPGMGTLEVTATTAGTEPDPDGYMVQMDAEAAQPVGSSGTVRSSDVTPGDHAVQLSGIAPNCAVAGNNPRTVSIAAGQTATVTFEITCGATSGGLQVTAATSGPSPDADGYTLTVDGAEQGTLQSSGALTLAALIPGAHEIGLSGVAGNCTVEGDNPQAVTVVAGESGTVAFVVTCAAPAANAGTLRVTTATTGTDPDPNGYNFTVDGGASQPIGVNGTASLANVSGGAHSVQLGGIAGNCTVQGTNPRSVIVSSGATAEASFAISCSATSGTIRVSVTTSGSATDPNGYTVKLDNQDPGQPIGTSGSVTFASVAAGSHTVVLTDVDSRCTAADGSSRNITVAVGASSEVSFAVTCTAPTPTGVTRWSSIPLGNAYRWSDLWGSSASNLLVTGFAVEPDRSAIWHYDGQAWSEQLRRGDTTVAAVWGSSAADVFAVGHRSGEADPAVGGTILHFNGSQWSDMAAPDHPYYAIWGTSPQDVFAGGSFAQVLHYDGSQWSEMPTTGFGPGAKIEHISGTSPTNVWAIGEHIACDDCNRMTNFVARYDGATWTRLYSTSDNIFNGLWVGAANDVWVVGRGFDGEGYILHYDGATWKETFRRTPEGIGLPPINDVWGSSSTDVYAVGGEGVLRYDGSSWSVIDSRPASFVWGTSANDIFVLDNNEMRHGTP